MSDLAPSAARQAGLSQPYLGRLIAALQAVDCAAIDTAVDVIEAAWRRGAQIITLGNGGSAMTALHYVTDWSKLVTLETGRPLYGRSLLDNMGVLTAYSNDVCYDDVFAAQLRHVMRPGDLVVAVSGSGNSENVIRAVDYANLSGGETLGLCGFAGGRLRQRARYVVWVPVSDMQLCEDVHAIFGHIVVQALCRKQADGCADER
jgi:D-sedoheptulose 7-phosphate isomerase